jgi:hypothetical protein
VIRNPAVICAARRERFYRVLAAAAFLRHALCSTRRRRWSNRAKRGTVDALRPDKPGASRQGGKQQEKNSKRPLNFFLVLPKGARRLRRAYRLAVIRWTEGHGVKKKDLRRPLAALRMSAACRPTGVGMEARKAETVPPTACAGLATRSEKSKAVGSRGSVYDSPTPFRGDAPYRQGILTK